MIKGIFCDIRNFHILENYIEGTDIFFIYTLLLENVTLGINLAHLGISIITFLLFILWGKKSHELRIF